MTLMLASDAKRRSPWFSMPVAQAERRRWRPIPVAEIMALQKEMAAAQKRIAQLEKALRQSKKRRKAA